MREFGWTSFLSLWLIATVIAAAACNSPVSVYVYDRSLLVSDAFLNDRPVSIAKNEREIDLELSEASRAQFRPTGRGGRWELSLFKQGAENMIITDFRVVAPYLMELEPMYVFRDEGPMFPQYYLRPSGLAQLKDLILPLDVADSAHFGLDTGAASQAREPHKYQLTFIHGDKEFHLRFTVQIPEK